MHRGFKIGLYCSDVPAAFDRVDAELLLYKLRSLSVSEDFPALLARWLDARQAVIVVDDQKSQMTVLHNMVYQGTVLVRRYGMRSLLTTGMLSTAMVS